MTAFRILLVFAVLFAIAGLALFFLKSFAYVAVLVIGAVFALGALGARLLRRPSGARQPERPLASRAAWSRSKWLRAQTGFGPGGDRAPWEPPR